MNIVILGAGSVGSYLATVLSQEEHNVIIIDHSPEALEKMSRSADVATRLGSGTDWRLLEDLLEFSPHLFIAMSSDDTTNLVACTLAKNLGYPKTIARIRQSCFLDPFRLDFNRLFSVDHILGTEMIVAHDLFKAILNPGNIAIENFAHGTVQMRTMVIPENFEYAGKPLASVHVSDHLLVGLIRRKIEKKESIIFPRGQDHLLPGDEVTFIGETHAMHKLPSLFGMGNKKIQSVVLVGGGGVAHHLCQLLLEQHIAVKVLEQDPRCSEELSRKFPEATILNHDGTDFAFLREEHVHSSDVFVAATPSTETNILAAALAKQEGCKEVIALISDESFTPLLQQLGITFVISERASISRQVHTILHDDAVIAVASLYDNQAQIMEVKISAESSLVGAPISDLSASFPSNFLIAMVENRKGIVVPRGNNVLAAGDTAIVICSPENIQDVENLF
ncbi:MAG: Trk system potassium transporter TrkA [Verrucomicrobia bacterium]|nr:Trk system potassium transporter TrkA [Verrucomicrobiota bacterium]